MIGNNYGDSVSIFDRNFEQIEADPRVLKVRTEFQELSELLYQGELVHDQVFYKARELQAIRSIVNKELNASQ